MAIVAVLGIPLAYWLARTKGPLTWLVGLIVQLPLALPPVMSGLVLIYIVGPYTWLGNLFNDELTGTVVGVVLAQTFVAGPFLVIAARTAFAGVDPALEDLAASLGRGPASRFWLVSMRIAAPGHPRRAAPDLDARDRRVRRDRPARLPPLHAARLHLRAVLLHRHPRTPRRRPRSRSASRVAVLLLSRDPAAAPQPQAPALPAPAPPPPVEPVAVSFNLDLAVGTFRLRVAHQSASNRIAILGPSGAGKSITLRAIAGFLGPQAGTVEFNGEEVAGVRVEDRRVGYVPQGLVMFPGRTAWQQVLFAAGADPGACRLVAAHAAARRAGGPAARGAVRRPAAARRARARARLPAPARAARRAVQRARRPGPRGTPPRAAAPAARGGPVDGHRDPRSRGGGPARRRDPRRRRGQAAAGRDRAPRSSPARRPRRWRGSSASPT